MIQRIQSVYLLFAFVACMCCLCLPVGHLVGGKVGGAAVMYNLWVLLPEDGRLWDVWALFVMMVLAATLSLITIFLYKNRLLQIRLCTFSILLVVGWYAAYAAFACLLAQRLDASFSPHWSASMPFAALVLLVLAWRGIARDERLVKSLDRLR